MKIIKTTLGWEIQPETNDEEAHVRWLIERLQPSWPTPVVVNENVPEGMVAAVTNEMLQRAAQAIACPRCLNYNCYSTANGCSWCGHKQSSPSIAERGAHVRQ